MIKTIEGYIFQVVIYLTAIVTMVTTYLGIVHLLFIAFDVLTGQVFAAVGGIVNITYIPGFDMYVANTGNYYVQALVGYIDCYFPFQSVVNSVLYIMSVEATILVARGIIGIYKLIPLKFT